MLRPMAQAEEQSREHFTPVLVRFEFFFGGMSVALSSVRRHVPRLDPFRFLLSTPPSSFLCLLDRHCFTLFAFFLALYII